MPIDYPALRSQLTTEFESLSAGIEDAAEIRRISDELARASQLILAQLVDRWVQGKDELRRLPNELLALCFTFLPLRDRITASHVSRHWRSIALAHPAMWADLEFYGDFFDEPALLLMALSRTGQYPVDLRCPEPDLGGTVAYCIATHMDHLRTLESSNMGDSIPLTRPAPLLETFCDTSDHINIPTHFLGGQAGRLRTLSLFSVTFPSVCPALSTITSLSLSMPRREEDAASFGRLFLLCPVLESLSIVELAQMNSHHLPNTPAPKSLTTLYLKTLDGQYDLMEHYLTWRTDNLTDVYIAQLQCVKDLPALILGAVEINVGLKYSHHNATYIGAIGPTGWSRALSFHQRASPEKGVAAMILGVPGGLSHAQSMGVPIRALPAFLRVLAGSPGLLKLTMAVDLGDLTPDKPHSNVAWDRLALLPQVVKRCPKLESIVLRVICSVDTCPPTAKDARRILAKLADIRDTKLPHVRVEGFEKDSLQGVVIPNFGGFRVEFI